MPYVDGWVFAVPIKNRDKFVEHARSADDILKELGATRVVECWGDDVPDGKITDFKKAVQAQSDEAVVLSWVEWPDRATRDTGRQQMHEMAQTDERFDEEKHPVPFDGLRMIMGGFEVVYEV